MAITMAQYETLLENCEQVITARNIEEYLIANPGPFPLPPSPPYATQKVTGKAQLEELLGAYASSSNPVHAAIVTTNASGLATFTYASTTTPVVAATVIDVAADNTFYQVALVSVSATSCTVRVTQNTSTVLLGISLLTVPSAANAVNVHIVVTPTN